MEKDKGVAVSFPPLSFNRNLGSAGSRLTSERHTEAGRSTSPPSLVDATARVRGELAFSLADVRQVTSAERAFYADQPYAQSAAIDGEFNGGQALPEGIRELRAQVWDEGRGANALNELDAVILDVIDEQHALANQRPSAAFPPAPGPGEDPGDILTLVGGKLNSNSNSDVSQGASVDINFDPTRRSAGGSSDMIPSSRMRRFVDRVQQDVDAYAVSELHMPPECAFNIRTLPYTDPQGRPLITSGLPKGRAEWYISNKLEPLVQNTFQARLAERVAQANPTTPAEWDKARRDAWLDTMRDPAVARYTQRMLDDGATTQPISIDLSSPIENATAAGNNALFAAAGQAFEVIPRNLRSLGVPVEELTPEEAQHFADQLGPQLGATYEAKVKEQLTLMGHAPATQAEFDRIQDEAWRATLLDGGPDGQSGVNRILLDVRNAGAGKATQAAADALDVFAMADGPYRTGIVAGKDLQEAYGWDDTKALEETLKGKKWNEYASARERLVQDYGPAAGQAFDSLVLHKLQEESQRNYALCARIPDISGLAGGPDLGTPPISAAEQTERRQSSTDTLNAYLLGKNAGALQEVRLSILNENGDEGAAILEKFDSLVLDELRNRSENNFRHAIVPSGLGSEVDRIVMRSPAMLAQLRQLQDEGWSVVLGEKGGGGYCVASTKTIVLDKGYGPVALAGGLAHEMGHALDDSPPPDESSKEAYVHDHLRGEAIATMSQMQARQEILANGGTDIGVAGRQSSRYKEAYAQYLKDGDYDAALERIITIYHDEVTSTNGKLYPDYYGDGYRSPSSEA